MKRKWFFPLSLLVSLLTFTLFFTPAYSQEATKEAQITVTASRFNNSVVKEGKSITVITEEDIKNSGKKSLSELLETVPGVLVTRVGTDGGLTGIFIRGGKRGNVLMMIDGVRISDPMGIEKAYDISGIMTAGIERIEIVRGSMSSLYGAEASGGVINIITKKATERKLIVSGEGGSDKSFRGTVSASDVTEQSTFFFTGSFFRTHGISKASKSSVINSYDDDGYSNTSASGRMTSALWDNALVNFVMNYSDSKADMDDGAFQDDPNASYTNKLFTTRGEFSHSPFSWFNYKTGVSYMSLVRSDVDPVDFIDTTESNASSFNGSNINTDLIMNFSIMNMNIITLGGELLNERGSSASAYSFAPGIFEEKNVLTKSLFIHDRLSIADMLFLNAGARLDSHEKFGNHYTWDASSSFIVPVIETQLRVSVGTGFRAPSLYELYDSWVGNEDLDPEKTLVYDAGVSQDLVNGMVILDFGVFRQKYTNLMGSDSSYKFINVDGTVKNSGFEASAVIKPADFISFTYGYTYIKYEGDADSKAVSKRPKHKHFASLLLMPLDGLSVMLAGAYIGKRYEQIYGGGAHTLDSYYTLDINVRYIIKENFAATLRCENITNSDYEETYGYNSKGLTVYAGLQAGF